MKPTHTPTPWILEHNADGMSDRKSIIGADGGEILRFRNVEDSDLIVANAAHIVKCVNLHDELVKKVDDLYRALLSAHYVAAMHYAEDTEALLARARGES